MIDRLVLFGATGDLAGRFLLPALAALSAAGRLPEGFGVVGAARNEWDEDTFRRHAADRLEQHASHLQAADRDALVSSLRYHHVEIDDPTSVAQVIRLAAFGDTLGIASGARDDVSTAGAGSESWAGARPVAAYLALPNGLFSRTVTTLGAVGLPHGSRIVVEKPFGEDLDSAVALNVLLRQVVGAEGEQAVFRVDHVLGMATVQNLLAMRLANRVLEPLWNSAHIEQIEILWEETLALEGRAGFYDRAGALKDVMQNHMLQILSLTAMELPASLEQRAVRDGKVDALRSVRPLTPEDVEVKTLRARYTAGRLCEDDGGEGEEVPAYADENGVESDRGTETFAEVVLELDNRRWSGTRFVLRGGKALARRRKGVVVRFRPVPHPAFGDAARRPPGNELWIGLDGPNDLRWSLTGSLPGHLHQFVPVTFTAPEPVSELPAYSRVLLDILRGDSTLSVRADEAEQAWRVLMPVLQGWADRRVPLGEYPAGSDGPSSPQNDPASVGNMHDPDEDPTDAVPVPPAPMTTAPSSTGMVADEGDAEEDVADPDSEVT